MAWDKGSAGGAGVNEEAAMIDVWFGFSKELIFWKRQTYSESALIEAGYTLL